MPVKRSKLIIEAALLLTICAIVGCFIWGSLPLESDNVTSVSNTAPSMSDPDGVVIYGCGVSNYLQLQVGETKAPSELVRNIDPLPPLVNELCIMTKGRHLFVALADVSRGNQMKGYSISNGSVVVLMHAEANP